MRHAAAEVCSAAACLGRVPVHLLLLASAAAAQEPHASGVESGARRLSWGTFIAEASNPTAAPVIVVQDVPETDLSDRSSLVVAGIVESFLHKTHLEPGELDCLRKGTGDLAGEVMSVSQNAMTLLQQVLGGKNGPASDDGPDSESKLEPRVNDGAGSISAMVDSMQAEDSSANAQPALAAQRPPQPQQAAQPPPQQQQAHRAASKSLSLFYGGRRLQMAAMAMSAPMLLMNLGYSCHHVADLTQDVVKKCVKGDARRAFKLAGQHMHSLRYIEGRLVANGADVVTELADALQSYQKNDFKSFGHDMGRVFRKVLLSRNTNGGLPEGLPGKRVIANMTAGVLRGFFGDGFALNLQTEPGYDPLHIDLHQCVGQNLAFFQSLWGATMLFYGKKDAQNEHTVSSRNKPSFGATLALTMMQLPTALRTCNIGDEEEQMLMDSIKRMGSGLHYDLELPEAQATSPDQIANDMATTVKDWARTEWYTFGLHVGQLLQEIFVSMYGQKWSVDHRGTLRKRLVEMAAAEQPLAGAGALVALRAQLAKIALVGAAPLLAALLVLRGRRSLSSRRDAPEDPEAPACSSEGIE
mmetsp:Transcript_59632/g.177415  ORF Transcript_59632/g.177415 Transcript_59632/m.177415 type:complete len:583 (+) Transcript_59632:86-1834(+)